MSMAFLFYFGASCLFFDKMSAEPMRLCGLYDACIICGVVSVC